MLKKRIEFKLKELNEYYKNNESVNHSALFFGDAGIFLFRLYYQNYLKEPNTHLESSLITFLKKTLESPLGSSSITEGISGFAWFLGHLQKKDIIELDEELFNDLDDIVYSTAVKELNDKNHDFMHGGLGNILYLANRIDDSKKAKKYCIELVKILDQIALDSNLGKYWVEEDKFILDYEKGKTIINLDLSHGQAGKVVILSKLLSKNIQEAKPVLEKAIQFMLENRNSDDEYCTIPFRIVNNKKEEFGHLGWCRGDVSMSIALLQAADALKDSSLKRIATNIAIKTTSINSLEKANIRDSHFCHGTGGLSHMYNRLYEYTGLEVFKEASIYWMEQVFVLDENNNDLIGSRTWDNPNKKWVSDYGLLNGSTGVGLSILAHISKESMSWDECMLLS